MRFRIGGVEFGSHPSGRAGSIIVTGFDPSGAEVRSQDHPRLGCDGVLPGRDFLGASTWSFELTTNGSRALEAREIYSRLQAVWHDPRTRGSAGELVALDYEVVGTNGWRRVYGRPRAFDSATGDVLMAQGAAKFGCEFEVMDPRFFSGSESGLHTHTLRHFGEIVGGIIAPVVAPVRTRGGSGARSGALVNDGSTDTPVHVTFTGPVRDPRLSSGEGWEVGFTGRLRSDERVEIDPMRHTVTLYDGDGRGRPAFSQLSRRSQLSRIGIPPGLTNVFFTGLDDTNSSTAVVSWRDAYQSI